LVGLAVDGQDGHVRISSGKGYDLYQGSPESHAAMQRKAEEFMAVLEARGLTLDNISRDECASVLEEIGMVMEEKVAS
jgi:hypothetical protein